jgi:hypothetical protein
MDNEALTQEGDNAFPEKETPPAPSTETTTSEDTQSSEGDKSEEKSEDNTQDEAPKIEEKLPPFHEHPRFKELIEENRTLKSSVSELSSFREKAEPLLSRFNPQEEVNIPSWFGGDETAYKAYLADQAHIVEEATQKAVKEIDERTSKEQQRIKEANEHFENSITDLEAVGNKVDRNKLLKFVNDNQLVDTEGKWNYKAGYQFMSAMEKAKADPSNLDARKQVAAATTSEPVAEPKKKDYQTPDSLRGKGWFNL